MNSTSFNSFIKALEQALAPPLPGSTAHDLLAPEHRKDMLLLQPDISKALLSSVLILFYADNKGKPNIIFTKRVEYKGVHSGQISFPGGKAEKTDKDIFETALRETEEEIGLKRNDIQVIGILSELYVPPSNFIIYPVVGTLYNKPVYKVDNKEVAKVISVPIEFFLKESSIGLHEVTTFENLQFHVPGFMIENNLIWGATAMILSELIMVVKNNTTLKSFFL
ncbi:MAG: NUDIX hydrolase [Chloroflexota bacterium]|nr:CoA pyrophosphatase [Lentimicrobium sp.]